MTRRNRLASSNLHLVDREATRQAARSLRGQGLPAWIERDDLVQDGRLGLLQAAERFDPERSTEFQVFASRRIKGAMIDANRRGNYAFELHAELHEAMQSGEAWPDEVAGRSELRERINAALARIAESDRALIIEHIFNDSPYAAIGARRGGKSASWAFYQVQNAMQNLRAVLANFHLDRAA